MILVTGATGFVGHALCNALARQQHAVRLALRAPRRNLPPHTDAVVVGDVHAHTDWSVACAGATTAIHLAARTHVMREHIADPRAAYRRINVEGTARLATQAAHAGVRRFVFLSSIKVNGESTAPAHPYTENDAPQPEDAYGVSKLEAEHALQNISRQTGMEIVVVRAPLIYGAGVKGNFLTLLDAVARGWPLPLASVHNRRSLLNVENLADALIACATHTTAANQTYLVADDAGVETPALIRAMGDALGKPARLFPFPTALLKTAGVLSGRTATIRRLIGSLQIDSGKIRRELGWQPRVTLAQGLADTARWYHARNANSLSK